LTDADKYVMQKRIKEPNIMIHSCSQNDIPNDWVQVNICTDNNLQIKWSCRKCVLAQLKNPIIVGLVGWFYGV